MITEHEQSAFLLHSRPYRENQLMLSFISERSGRISALTYCSHKKTAKKALLQPFRPLRITLKGSGSLKNLSQVEAVQKSYSLQEHYLYSGFYLNELLYRLLEDDITCPELFLHYQQSIQALDQQKNIEPILRQFENQLLEELGLSIDFSPVFADNCPQFNYIHEEGFVPAMTHNRLTCYSNAHLRAIAEQKLNDDVLKTYKKLMRQIIDHLLGNVPLNSRKLFVTKETIRERSFTRR